MDQNDGVRFHLVTGCQRMGRRTGTILRSNLTGLRAAEPCP